MIRKAESKSEMLCLKFLTTFDRLYLLSIMYLNGITEQTNQRESKSMTPPPPGLYYCE